MVSEVHENFTGCRNQQFVIFTGRIRMILFIMKSLYTVDVNICVDKLFNHSYMTRSNLIWLYSKLDISLLYISNRISRQTLIFPSSITTDDLSCLFIKSTNTWIFVNNVRMQIRQIYINSAFIFTDLYTTFL